MKQLVGYCWLRLVPENKSLEQDDLGLNQVGQGGVEGDSNFTLDMK